MHPETLTIEQYVALTKSIEGVWYDGYPVEMVCRPRYRPPKSEGPIDEGGWAVDIITSEWDHTYSIASVGVKQAEMAGIITVRDFTSEDIGPCDFNPGKMEGWKVLEVVAEPE